MTIYLAFLNLHFDDLQFKPSLLNVLTLLFYVRDFLIMIFIIFFSPKTGPYKTLCEHSDCKRENRLYSSVGIINRGPFKFRWQLYPISILNYF